MSENSKDFLLLPHHEQKELCTTRLPYRQGRKLTAVKVYTINNESRHLLVFGVPSLNLRQEAKGLFLWFGKLLQFHITKYPSEQFTETYHAVYEDIQSARIAKKMLDTKNFYGGVLHICYAPELENLEETRQKIQHRQKNVVGRLKNLQNEKVEVPKINISNIEDVNSNKTEKNIEKIFMGAENQIRIGKRKLKNKSMKKKQPTIEDDIKKSKLISVSDEATSISSQPDVSQNVKIIDFTSTNSEILTNINESLNYDKFGTELVKQVPYKPVNKIKFSINKNS